MTDGKCTSFLLWIAIVVTTSGISLAQGQANVGAAAVTVPPSVHAANTLSEACREDAKRLCGSGEQRKDVPACLLAMRFSLSSAGCRSWVAAYDRCANDVKKQCKGPLSHCLRKTPPDQLSTPCKETQFYRSVMLWARFRALKEKKDKKKTD